MKHLFILQSFTILIKGKNLTYSKPTRKVSKMFSVTPKFHAHTPSIFSTQLNYNLGNIFRKLQYYQQV